VLYLGSYGWFVLMPWQKIAVFATLAASARRWKPANLRRPASGASSPPYRALADALEIQQLANRTIPQLIGDQLQNSGPFLLKPKMVPLAV
jgi:hypothetical protein